MMKKYLIILVAFLSLSLAGRAGEGLSSQGFSSSEQASQFSYYWYAAKNAIDNERYADAYVLLQFCNELKPNDAQTLYYLGVMYQGLGKQQESLETFERAYRATSKKARSGDLLIRLQREYMSQGLWKKALKIQDELDEQDGYDAYSAITRYRIYAMSSQPQKAIKEIDRYLKTDPNNMQFLLFRLELMEQTKAKPKQLIAMYKRILAIDPYNLIVLNNYAYLLATHGGDLNEAEQMSAVTIREQPNNPTFLDTYGWILYLKGQKELALFYLNRALWNTTEENMRSEVLKHIKEIEK